MRYYVEFRRDAGDPWQEAEPMLAPVDRYTKTREVADEVIKVLRWQDAHERCEYEYRVAEIDYVGCECGAVTGEPCAWVGDPDETVVLEWMPRDLRASHEAAGNRGTFPQNGAERLRLEQTCADAILEGEGGWARIVDDRY